LVLLEITTIGSPSLQQLHVFGAPLYYSGKSISK